MGAASRAAANTIRAKFLFIQTPLSGTEKLDYPEAIQYIPNPDGAAPRPGEMDVDHGLSQIGVASRSWMVRKSEPDSNRCVAKQWHGRSAPPDGSLAVTLLTHPDH